MIVLVKRSSQYRHVRYEISVPVPVDIWWELGTWFVVFEMKSNLENMIIFRVSTPSASVEGERILINREEKLATVTDLNGQVLRSIGLEGANLNE